MQDLLSQRRLFVEKMDLGIGEISCRLILLGSPLLRSEVSYRLHEPEEVRHHELQRGLLKREAASFRIGDVCVDLPVFDIDADRHPLGDVLGQRHHKRKPGDGQREDMFVPGTVAASHTASQSAQRIHDHVLFGGVEPICNSDDIFQPGEIRRNHDLLHLQVFLHAACWLHHRPAVHRAFIWNRSECPRHCDHSMTDSSTHQNHDIQATVERVLFVAPHPDDETLAAGGFLRRLSQAGSRVFVLFLTDGERNPLAHSALEQRICFGSAARERFRVHRRAEALRALARIGVSAEDCSFFALPDSRVGQTLAEGKATAVIDKIRALITVAGPSLILAPCQSDLHPDHRAAAQLLSQAMDGSAGGITTLRYTIHRSSGMGTATGVVIPLSSREIESKRAAIQEYRSQLILSGPRFLSFAKATEEFHYSCSIEPVLSTGPRRLLRLWTILRGCFRNPDLAGEPSLPMHDETRLWSEVGNGGR